MNNRIYTVTGRSEGGVDIRADRCNTTLTEIKDDEQEEMDEQQEIFEYGFGTPFSYWKDWGFYEYIPPKYENLKEELLQNAIHAIQLKDYQEVIHKAETVTNSIEKILGKGADKNTPYARFNQQLNAAFGIEAKQVIDAEHIASILFYTDLTNLPREMKKICRKLKDTETAKDVKQRHSEMVNWLRLLFETIFMWGNTYGTDDPSVYHGLNRKFYFREFKAKFFIPTSATTDKSIAINFAEDNGIILEFSGLETVGDHYFVKFYSYF